MEKMVAFYGTNIQIFKSSSILRKDALTNLNKTNLNSSSSSCRKRRGHENPNLQ